MVRGCESHAQPPELEDHTLPCNYAIFSVLQGWCWTSSSDILNRQCTTVTLSWRSISVCVVTSLTPRSLSASILRPTAGRCFIYCLEWFRCVLSITGNVSLSVSTGILFCSRLALTFISVSTHFLSICMVDGMWRVDGMGKMTVYTILVGNFIWKLYFF